MISTKPPQPLNQSVMEFSQSLNSGVALLLGTDNLCWPAGKCLSQRERYTLLYVFVLIVLCPLAQMFITLCTIFCDSLS